MPIPDEIREQPGSKVSSQINRIAGLPAERRTDSKDQEEQAQGNHISRTEIRIIFQRKDHEYKYSTGDDLREDLSRLRQEGLRIRIEHTRGCGVGISWDGEERGAPLICVNGGFVIAVDDGGAAEAARDLCAGVDGELVPRKLAVEAVDECDGRV